MKAPVNNTSFLEPRRDENFNGPVASDITLDYKYLYSSHIDDIKARQIFNLYTRQDMKKECDHILTKTFNSHALYHASCKVL